MHQKEGSKNHKCQHYDKHKHIGGDKKCWELNKNATNPPKKVSIHEGEEDYLMVCKANNSQGGVAAG